MQVQVTPGSANHYRWLCKTITVCSIHYWKNSLIDDFDWLCWFGNNLASIIIMESLLESTTTIFTCKHTFDGVSKYNGKWVAAELSTCSSLPLKRSFMVLNILLCTKCLWQGTRWSEEWCLGRCLIASTKRTNQMKRLSPNPSSCRHPSSTLVRPSSPFRLSEKCFFRFWSSLIRVSLFFSSYILTWRIVVIVNYHQ